MTLQNKKTHLLDDDEQDNASDIPDIFDQYGGGEDDISMPNPVATAQSVTRPRTDDDMASDAPVPQKQESEKKWEQEYEEETTKETSPAMPEIPSAPEMPKENPVSPVTTPKVPEIKEVKVPESVTVPRPQKDIDLEQSAPKVEKTKVAAPIKQNHNSVVQGRPKQQTQKKSMRPKEDKPLREVHIDPGKKTIMIVDDDIDTLDMYADVFESANYNVIRAADGLEAMNLVAEHTPHVIFTGIVMPRMDGFSMMEALKQNKRTTDIPIVINSHLGRDTDKDKAEELGARDFIIRGFTQPREVVERIGALLLKSEYVFRFNKNDKEARKLAKDLGTPNFYHCPRGQEMVLKLSVTDEKDLTFSARFSCVDSKEDKK